MSGIKSNDIVNWRTTNGRGNPCENWQVVTFLPGSIIYVDCNSGRKRQVWLDGTAKELPMLVNTRKRPAPHSVRWSERVDDCERKAAMQGLTLATLCDLVIGEDANDRSDDALVKAVAKLVRAKSPTGQITKEGITVESGQVWRDLDKRCGGRTKTVIEVKDGKALMDGPKRVRVAVRRMHRHSTGWSLVSPIAPDQRPMSGEQKTGKDT